MKGFKFIRSTVLDEKLFKNILGNIYPFKDKKLILKERKRKREGLKTYSVYVSK